MLEMSLLNMKETQHYWQSTESLLSPTRVDANEFAQELPLPKDRDQWKHSRRDFLKLMGFSIAAASAVACEAPIRKAIPYLNKPTDLDPGIPNYYATTYMSGSICTGLVVKTREGRPIKIEGNPADLLSQGGVSAQVEASVLTLYDSSRAQGPLKNQQAISWKQLDEEVIDALEKLSAEGRRILLMSHSIHSPSTLRSIEKLRARYPSVEHISYDTPSYAAMLDVNEKGFGIRALPAYDFSEARVIASFGADFLGTWLSPTLFSAQFAKRRKVSAKQRRMSKLYVYESNMSLTGAAADERLPIEAGQYPIYLANLYNLLARNTNISPISTPELPQHQALLEEMAAHLWKNRGQSLVVSGCNSYESQVLCCKINQLLGNYGKVISWQRPYYTAKGSDQAIHQAIQDASAGRIGGIIFYNCNPVYEHPQGEVLSQALAKISFTLSTSEREDETSAKTQYLAPDTHYLESWNDAEAMHGYYQLVQPTISPLFSTRQVQSSFLKWAGESEDYLSFIKDFWKKYIYTSDAGVDFTTFFNQCLYKGTYEHRARLERPPTLYKTFALSEEGLEIRLPKPALRILPYFSVALGSGEQANNPWLQELPDPITKVSWENVATLSPARAESLGIHMQDVNHPSYWTYYSG